MLLDPDTVCAIIFKARRYHGKEAARSDVLASNDVDEGQPDGPRMDNALVDGRDGGNISELKGLIAGLESQQATELTGLFLYGREKSDYADLETAIAAASGFDRPILAAIMDDAASPEYLAAGLEATGNRCTGSGTAA